MAIEREGGSGMVVQLHLRSLRSYFCCWRSLLTFLFIKPFEVVVGYVCGSSRRGEFQSIGGIIGGLWMFFFVFHPVAKEVLTHLILRSCFC